MTIPSSLEDLFNLYGSNDLKNRLKADRVGTRTLSRSEVQYIENKFRTHLSKGRVGSAADLLILFLWSSPNQFELPRDFNQVMFFESHVDGSTSKVLDIALNWEEQPQWRERLQSLKHLSDLVQMKEGVEHSLWQYLNTDKYLAPNLLAYIEDLIWNRPSVPDFVGRSPSIEAKLTALGYVIGNYFREKSASGFPENLGPHRNDRNETLEQILELGLTLRQLHELKSKIVQLGYNLTKAADESYRVSHPIDGVEEFYQAGWTTNLFQTMISAAMSRYRDTATVAAVERLVDAHGELITPLVGERDTLRLRMQFPEDTIQKVGKILLEDAIFPDERELLEHISYELLWPIDKILNFELSENLSILDLVKFLRVMNFFCRIKDSALKKIWMRGVSAPEYWNSLLGFKKERDFVELIATFGFSKNKIDSIFQLLSYDAGSKDSYFDPFYFPLVKVKEKYFILLFTLQMTNLIRNAFFTSKARIDSGGKADPLGDFLAPTIKARTELIAREVKYKFEGFEGDFDIIFKIEDDVYILELKNSLLPTDPYEVRSLWDAMKKASDQLSKAVTLMKKPDFISYINAKLPFALSGGEKVHTGIVLGQRLYSGLSLFGHPVRSGRELNRYLTDGLVGIGDLSGKNKRDIKLWSGDNFESKDLVSYLSESSILHANIRKSLVNETVTNMIGETRVEEKKYIFDMRLFAKAFGYRLDLATGAIEKI